ncbi:hypothetical protein NDU88_001279 [Pleurodeles waltl]|uniref:Uncharacterized protein n=1 Tax=Pleurodeles waltl TaxID=8319 RepID=A0AAV7RB60_PLEWA|nr:hypothetical protein NDU88_001279 [Pleurodeles waltl]
MTPPRLPAAGKSPKAPGGHQGERSSAGPETAGRHVCSSGVGWGSPDHRPLQGPPRGHSSRRAGRTARPATPPRRCT